MLRIKNVVAEYKQLCLKMVSPLSVLPLTKIQLQITNRVK